MEQAAQQAIEAYNKASRELAALHRERGDLVAAQIDARVQGYQDVVAQGGTVSDARHAADMASKHMQQEVAKLDGEISGLETELRYLDQLLLHARWVTSRNERAV